MARTFRHQSVVFAVAFSPDGTLLAGGGYDSEKGTHFVRLWEVATGKERRRFETARGGTRSLAFSADGKALATGDDSARPKPLLRLFDVESGKERRQIPFPDGSSVRSVAFAPDGLTVAASGGSSTRLFAVSNGKELLRLDGKAIGLHFSANGKVLTGAVAGAIRRWGAATGRPLTPEGAESPVDQVLVAPDGKRVVARGQDGDVHVWDGRTGAHLRRLSATWQRGIALSPDGRFLAWPTPDESVKYELPGRWKASVTGSRLRLYDLSAGRFVERFPAFKGEAHRLFFAPGGKALITVDFNDGRVRAWDVATGKEQRSFLALRKGEKVRPYYLWSSALSPDGKTLAVTYQRADNTTALLGAYAVRLWDVATGKELHDLPGHLFYVEGLAFSPDGRSLVTGSDPLAPFIQRVAKRPANQVYVWDVATGRRVVALPEGLPIGAQGAAFAPDGRTLATASPDGAIRLWEVATWSVRAEFRGHRDRVTRLAFARDGRLLSGSLDTTVLAWNVRPPRPRAAGALAAAWADLLQLKAAPAFRAQGRLLASPPEAVALFEKTIEPVEAVDPKRLARLIADLDSADFDARDKATQELRALGGRAAPVLRVAAKKPGSLEPRLRAARLLAELHKGPTAEELRALRAVEVLEWADTAEARRLLRAWAKGAPGARLTGAAEAAVGRLKAHGGRRE